MKTLIIGGSSKIGKNFNKNSKKKTISTFYSNKIKNGIKFDLLKSNIKKIILEYSISKVVILSAHSNTDFCYKNKKISNLLNVKSTIKVVKELIKKNIYFIFFSSEMVYSGKKGNYSETDKTYPINYYGKQKLKVENYIKKNTKNYAIFRLAKTYDCDENSENFFSEFFRSVKKGSTIYNAATDQKFNPIFVKDVIDITNFFLKNKIKGVFNLAGPKVYSRYDCLKILKNELPKQIKKKIRINKIKLRKMKFIEKRPINLSLKVNKLIKTYKHSITPLEKVVKSVKKF